MRTCYTAISQEDGLIVLRAYLLKILRVSMMSLKDTKFSMRQCSLILLPVDVVSGSDKCSACPAALTPSGMLAAGT